MWKHKNVEYMIFCRIEKHWRFQNFGRLYCWIWKDLLKWGKSCIRFPCLNGILLNCHLTRGVIAACKEVTTNYYSKCWPAKIKEATKIYFIWLWKIAELDVVLCLSSRSGSGLSRNYKILGSSKRTIVGVSECGCKGWA